MVLKDVAPEAYLSYFPPKSEGEEGKEGGREGGMKGGIMERPRLCILFGNSTAD
jgi:hypothetical protein